MSITKFVIYHQPRTGSTMLWGILGNHPEIYCERELFHQKYERDAGFCYSQYNSAKEYLETFYPLIQTCHKAFGFKLQGYQAQDDDMNDVRDYLRSQNFKYIIPYRMNKLDQFISQSVAKKRDIWQRWVETPYGEKKDDPEFEVMKVHVTEKDFYNWYRWDRNLTSQIEDNVKGKEVLNVTYERFLQDRENQTNRILDFLGVTPMPLEAKTKKAREKPLREWIANYEEACEIHDSIATPHEIEYRIEHEQ